jgi:4-amino-4-deoxy-L-arabinose transferase-like glycosyltransferase
MHDRLRASLFLAMAVAFFLFLKGPSLRFEEIENDELVYVSVALNLKVHGKYSLQGTGVLAGLSPQIYDRPFFHHPPLAIWLMTPLVSAERPTRTAVLVSWLGHLLMVVGIAQWLRVILSKQERGVILPAVVLLAVVDPIGILTGQRIWLDALLGGLTAVGTGLYLMATSASSRARENALLVASGIVLGLATLTKLPGMLALPVLVAIYFWRRRPGGWRTAARHLLWVGGAFVVVVIPWFAKFYAYYGTLFPDWIRPDAWTVETFEYVRTVGDRPPYYFLKQLFLVYPWLAFVVGTSLAAVRRRDGAYAVAWTFLLGILLCLTGLAVFAGHNYQMRYLTMAVTPLYVLAALTVRDLLDRKGWALVFLVFATATGAGCALVHVVRHTWFDLHNLAQILYGAP